MPLMTDIAEAAEVSLATVDRVLNRRKGVKARTVERVLKAALELGYLSEAEHAQLIHPRPPNVAFLLPMGGNPYLRLLGDKVRAVAQSKSRDEAQVRCYFIESFDAGALAAAIRHHAGWADGIAFLAIDHPLVREAVEEVSAAGRRIVTIVSDLQHSLRDAYVGLDNQAAGRTAGYLLGRFCRAREGSVALVAGSRNYRAHAEREMGFLGLLEEMHPGLRVVGMREGHDDREENYRHALSLLEQNADLVGIYNVGGSSDGIGRALREHGRSGEVVFIGHGLTADTRRLLIEGTMDAVINSDPDVLLTSALHVFGSLQRDHASNPTVLPPVKMDLFFRENIPSVLSVAGGTAMRRGRRAP
ncbi:LacI family DNA-binding transcriptional regulator [Chelativorans xinjiangense]|uniref:LacI family DNA-binding transcriptional regulator n=1 Tax=Chelativorans xinjiangense TaxID=2681485 RepID=UPI001FE5054C|nr:LacI family DNA-binding transcriptional regulator [Chelativorans xinjiangense]